MILMLLLMQSVQVTIWIGIDMSMELQLLLGQIIRRRKIRWLKIGRWSMRQPWSCTERTGTADCPDTRDRTYAGRMTAYPFLQQDKQNIVENGQQTRQWTSSKFYNTGDSFVQPRIKQEFRSIFLPLLSLSVLSRNLVFVQFYVEFHLNRYSSAIVYNILGY